MKKAILLISLVVLAIFIAGCNEQAGEAGLYIQKSAVRSNLQLNLPPAVSNLRAAFVGCNNITWNWTNPAAGFDRLHVRVASGTRDVWSGTFPKTTNLHTQGGLTENTPYTRYVTTIANVNKVDVRGGASSNTATTSVCSPTTCPPGTTYTSTGCASSTPGIVVPATP